MNSFLFYTLICVIAAGAIEAQAKQDRIEILERALAGLLNAYPISSTTLQTGAKVKAYAALGYRVFGYNDQKT